jgi:hypothetical protein
MAKSPMPNWFSMNACRNGDQSFANMIAKRIKAQHAVKLSATANHPTAFVQRAMSDRLSKLMTIRPAVVSGQSPIISGLPTPANDRPLAGTMEKGFQTAETHPENIPDQTPKP